MTSSAPVAPRPGEPLGVYIHFPFCARRCPYCDFNTRACDDIPHDAYLDAVLSELRARAALFEGRRLVSIYFGGGTPGLWRPSCVAAVVSAVKELWAPMDDAQDLYLQRALYGPRATSLEVTLEANPGSVKREALAALLEAGVNRLSVGVQSFNDAYLRRLGRLHDADAAHAFLAEAARVGFKRLSLDLLFGGPKHTLEAFARDLDLIPTVPVLDHISAYSLIVEEGTPFGQLALDNRLQEAPEDDVVDMLERCEATLQRFGLPQYETSSYSRRGREARHNSLYWTGGEYMGLGVGAHEYRIEGGQARRRSGAQTLRPYLDDPGCASFQETLSASTRLVERVYLALRTHFGVSMAQLAREFPSHLLFQVPAVLEGLETSQWVKRSAPDDTVPAYLGSEDPRYVPTRRGFLFGDAIARRVLDSL